MATARPRQADGAPSRRASAAVDLDSFPVFPRRRPPDAEAAAPLAAMTSVVPTAAAEPAPRPHRGRDLGRLTVMLMIPVLSVTALTVWAGAPGRPQPAAPITAVSPARPALVDDAVALARDVERLRTTRRREQAALDELRRRTMEARLELDRLERRRSAVPPPLDPPLPQQLSAPPIVVGAAPRPSPPPPEALVAEPPPVDDAAAVAAAIPTARIVIHHTRGGPITRERVRSLASALEQRAIGDTSVRPVDFAISRTAVRYFFAGDAERAADLHWLTQEADPRARDGATEQPQDFTHFRPLPRRGTIEIWLAS